MSNSDKNESNHISKISFGGLIVAIGIVKEEAYFVKFTLGFRVEPRINYLMELVLNELEKRGEVERTSKHPALQKYDIEGDIRFVLLRSFLSYENDLTVRQNIVLRTYYFLRHWFAINEDEAYGLDASNIVIERVPMVVNEPRTIDLVRD